MRNTLTAFVLLFLCPVAVAGADEYEEHANDASPADGPPENPGATPQYSNASDSTTAQESSSILLPPPCRPDC